MINIVHLLLLLQYNYQLTITSVYVEYEAETQNSQNVFSFFLNPYNFITNISLLFVLYAFSKLKNLDRLPRAGVYVQCHSLCMYLSNAF
jgi:hypothetical protein